MEVTFLGATHEVTGSCTYLAACDKHLLIDYGMEQGKNTIENEPLPILPSEIDYVLLTHAHIDHSGLLPLLIKNGFHGEVHSTVILSSVDDGVFKRLGMRLTCEPVYEKNSLYHK